MERRVVGCWFNFEFLQRGVIPKARVFTSGPRDLPRNGGVHGKSLAPPGRFLGESRALLGMTDRTGRIKEDTIAELSLRFFQTLFERIDFAA